MKTLIFRVEGNCKPKERPRLGRRGRVYTPKATLAYESKVRGMALQKKAKASDLRVRLYCEFNFSTRHRRDIDNCVKTVMDGLNGVAWEDDAQVVHLEAHKFYNKGNGYTFVRVEYY